MPLLSGAKSACIRSDSVYVQMATGMFFIRLSDNTGGRFFLGPSLSAYESRGLHYSRDYPGQLDHALDTVLEPWEQASFAR